jgi:hypothetical protein
MPFGVDDRNNFHLFILGYVKDFVWKFAKESVSDIVAYNGMAPGVLFNRFESDAGFCEELMT